MFARGGDAFVEPFQKPTLYNLGGVRQYFAHYRCANLSVIILIHSYTLKPRLSRERIDTVKKILT